MLRARLQLYATLLFVALAGGAWIHATRFTTDVIPASIAPRVNFAMPAFTLNTLDGNTLASENLRGKIVLVNFWATWCPPCRSEMPLLQSIAKEYATKDVVVIAIDVGEDRATVMQYAQNLGLTFPILLDEQTNVATTFQVSAMPTSFFVDREGVIRAAYLGAMNRAYIQAQLVPLLEPR